MRTRRRSRAGHIPLALALGAAFAACAPRASQPVSVRDAGLALEARLTPAAPRVGDNQLLFTLRDAAGAPVAGAHVEATVRMPAMGAMAPMGGTAAVRELGAGRYQATFGLDMSGTWDVAIAVHAPGGAALAARGSLTVGSAGLQLSSDGAPQAGAEAGPPPTTPGAQRSPASTPAGPGTAPASFSFPPERLRQIGVRSVPAAVQPLARRVRASARVVFDERGLVDVTPRVAGFVDTLAVAAVGEPVVRGQTLLTLVSPELYAAQREYQQALASGVRAADGPRREPADALVRAAEHRLALLGIAPRDVAAIAHSAQPFSALPLRAPEDGVVIEKNVVLGSAVSAGEQLLRIAPQGRVWLEAALAESDLPLVREGMPAQVLLAGESAPRAGHVVRVLPQLAAESRTATARIALDGADAARELRPGAWASALLAAPARDALAVPSSAVLRAGERGFVFVAGSDGSFTPRAVTTGLETPEAIEILSGLAVGEAVVSEGTYLIASESRLRAALSQW